MASSRPNALTPFQLKYLNTFFATGADFFLTGGTALAGWYLFHRRSDDLDLFTLSDTAWQEVRRLVPDVARSLGARLEEVRTAPGFLRYLVTSPEGVPLLVDYVRDQDIQIQPDKPVFGHIRVDAIADIVCNKLSAVVSRTEVKDFVDLYCLDVAGYLIPEFVERTQRKFGGIEPPLLASVLARFRLDASPPFMLAPLDLEALHRRFNEVADQIARDAYPGSRA